MSALDALYPVQSNHIKVPRNLAMYKANELFHSLQSKRPLHQLTIFEVDGWFVRIIYSVLISAPKRVFGLAGGKRGHG